MFKSIDVKKNLEVRMYSVNKMVFMCKLCLLLLKYLFILFMIKINIVSIEVYCWDDKSSNNVFFVFIMMLFFDRGLIIVICNVFKLLIYVEDYN